METRERQSMTPSPAQRRVLEAQKAWIMRWLRGSPFKSTSAGDEVFHDRFAEEFEVRQKNYLWGACPCPVALNRLREMWREGLLSRFRTSCGEWRPGQPKWLYVYEVKPADRSALKLERKNDG